jgi:ATP-dependent RNA helicase DOB1
MRVEDVDPEYMLRASFYQFQREQDAPALVARAEELEEEAKLVELGKPDEAQLAQEFFQMDQQLAVTRKKIKGIVQKPEYVWKFLQQPGRIIDVVIDGEAYGWGALVACQNNQGVDASKDIAATFTLRVLLMCVELRPDECAAGRVAEAETANVSLPARGLGVNVRPVKHGIDENIDIQMRQFILGLDQIEKISAVRIIMPQEVTTSAGRKKVELSLRELLKRFPNDTMPLLDPVKDLGVRDTALETLLNRAQALVERLSEHKLATDFGESRRSDLLTAYEKKMELQQQASVLRDEARSCQAIEMKDDMKKMKKVLKRLGHVDANGVIQTKGRSACEVGTFL